VTSTQRARRRRALLVAALAVLLAATVAAAPLHLLDGSNHRDFAGTGDRNGPAVDSPSGGVADDGRTARLDVGDSGYLSTDGWPQQGQGAYVLDGGRPAVSPHQRPVPIASVAKVMTAYLVLKHAPLDAGDDGRTFAVSASDVLDTVTRQREGQSVVAVSAGEQLTERQALMAILLPSANNVAVLVARQLAGSVPAFVAEMNRTARALGMSHTTYTDPSGYDAGTVSTALDQLRLARAVAKNRTLAAMMATRSYTLPVAGVVNNTNGLLGSDGFVGMKTGSDQAAGGCLMFHAVWPSANGSRSLIGVVLGQRGDNLVAAGLAAARQLAERLQHGSAPAAPSPAPGAVGGPATHTRGPATLAEAYRPHIENRIQPGNGSLR
jgi:D-alanyl-D-alanine carboxypeptidase (penicillin-binding protein 5/6)